MKKAGTKGKSPRFSAEIRSGATRAERKELGKLARQHVPLEYNSNLSIPKSGRNIIHVLEESNKGRIKDLIPIRYGRMLASPFTFYRGSAALMALDLSTTPSSGLHVQACGDCHIQNFGAYATPERKIVIDINDFDETHPAPWEWDVKRLAASFVLAATESGFSDDIGKDAAYRMARAYREYCGQLAEMTHLEVWYSHVEANQLLELSDETALKRRKKSIQDAVRKSSPEYLMEKYITISGGKMRFRDMPPLLSHVEGVTAGDLEKQAFAAYHDTLRDHRRVLLEKYEMVDIARKVVGIGSVGTACGVILLASDQDDLLVLQLKEARRSVLEPYTQKSKYEHQGERIVAGQKLMQAAADQLLGWTTGVRPPHRHFFIRQLRDVKIGTNTMFWTKADYKTIPVLAGQILARAHARSGDASFMKGYLGKTDAFEQAISSYAKAYAEQTRRDYNQFAKACKAGILKAEIMED